MQTLNLPPAKSSRLHRSVLEELHDLISAPSALFLTRRSPQTLNASLPIPLKAYGTQFVASLVSHAVPNVCYSFISPLPDPITSLRNVQCPPARQQAQVWFLIEQAAGCHGNHIVSS